jgi:hypothetical protein
MGLTLIVVTVAQLLDLGTFIHMVELHGASAEANPLVSGLLLTGGLPYVAAAKVAALALVIAAIVVLRGRVRETGHRRLAAAVATVAILAGLVGGMTNAGTILAAAV